MLDAIGSLTPIPQGHPVEVARAMKDNKHLVCVGATVFNLSSSVVAGFSPGCWTRPRLEEQGQFWGSLLGAGAVVATHYFLRNPYGPPVIIASSSADFGFTSLSLHAGMCLKPLTVDRIILTSCTAVDNIRTLQKDLSRK